MISSQKPWPLDHGAGHRMLNIKPPKYSPFLFGYDICFALNVKWVCLEYTWIRGPLSNILWPPRGPRFTAGGTTTVRFHPGFLAGRRMNAAYIWGQSKFPNQTLTQSKGDIYKRWYVSTTICYYVNIYVRLHVSTIQVVIIRCLIEITGLQKAAHTFWDPN